MFSPSRIGLGTVQFGLQYGTANSGVPSRDEVSAILGSALREGIRVVDTASSYGASEAILGGIPETQSFKVVTKTLGLGKPEIDSNDVDQVERVFHQSLTRLKRSSVYGLLVHDPFDLLAKGSDRLLRKLLELRERGLIEKLGVSVYTGDQIDAILTRHPVDLIQIPVSVFDQRLIQNGYLKELKKQGVEIHSRSVFLQGSLLMDPLSLPSHLSKMKKHLSRFHREIRARGLTPLQVCLAFVLGLSEIDVTLCGVISEIQLREILDASAKGPIDDFPFRSFAIESDTILNPSNWKASA